MKQCIGEIINKSSQFPYIGIAWALFNIDQLASWAEDGRATIGSLSELWRRYEHHAKPFERHSFVLEGRDTVMPLHIPPNVLAPSDIATRNSSSTFTHGFTVPPLHEFAPESLDMWLEHVVPHIYCLISLTTLLR